MGRSRRACDAFYGSPRLTKDIDIIASNHLSLTPQYQLSFGGSSYTTASRQICGSDKLDRAKRWLSKVLPSGAERSH